MNWNQNFKCEVSMRLYVPLNILIISTRTQINFVPNMCHMNYQNFGKLMTNKIECLIIKASKFFKQHNTLFRCFLSIRGRRLCSSHQIFLKKDVFLSYFRFSNSIFNNFLRWLKASFLKVKFWNGKYGTKNILKKFWCTNWIHLNLRSIRSHDLLVRISI